MATPESVKQKLQALIDKVNKETGLQDITLTQAVTSALAVELEEAYGKLFSRFPLEEDKMYAIGYNWFAELVKLTQTMSFINRDLTPEEILAVLSRVEYFPHIFIEECITPQLLEQILMAIKPINEELSIETQKPTPGSVIEPFTKIKITPNLITIGTTISEEVSISPIWTQNDVQVKEDLLTWNYNPRYVTLNSDGSMILQTQWVYESKEDTIDKGYLTIVKAITEDLNSIEEVSIND